MFWICSFFLFWKFQYFSWYFKYRQKYFETKASKHLMQALYISLTPHVMLLFKKVYFSTKLKTLKHWRIVRAVAPVAVTSPSPSPTKSVVRLPAFCQVQEYLCARRDLGSRQYRRSEGWGKNTPVHSSHEAPGQHTPATQSSKSSEMRPCHSANSFHFIWFKSKTVGFLRTPWQNIASQSTERELRLLCFKTRRHETRLSRLLQLTESSSHVFPATQGQYCKNFSSTQQQYFFTAKFYAYVIISSSAAVNKEAEIYSKG